VSSRYDDELWELVPEEPGPPSETLRGFVRSLGHVERALDLGCGDGRLTAELDAGELTAADVSPVALERARRRLPDARIVELEPDTALPFDDGSFELVYCKQVLEHVEHPRELLAEVARVLAPGGHLAGSTSQLEAFHSRSTLNWTPYGFTRLAEDAGLEVVELRPVIDGFTLVAWRALGLPRFFHRWWSRESPPYRVIELAARAARLDPRTRNQVKLVLAGQFAFLARRA
jgi:SAM-dependent methyltransferase